MCGIVGYIGKKEALPIIIDGLKLLEYRGYDSAGIAVQHGHTLQVVKTVGKIAELEKELKKSKVEGTTGIGHTRWATHGRPSTANSHPHQDAAETLVLVHNGIIENYHVLKLKLEEKGIKFRSETDTEVLIQLIGIYYAQNQNLEEAVRNSLNEVEGTYGIAVYAKADPHTIIVAKKASPLCLGLGNHEVFISSDAIAFIRHTKKAVYLKDEEMAVVTAKGVEIKTIKNKPVTLKVTELSLDPADIEKGEYPHYMLKEIFEQPRAIQDTIDGRISEDNTDVLFKNLKLTDEYFLQINRIVIAACGTSWHAALIGEYALEKFARIPVETEYAAEFRYRTPIVDERTLVITISQSGETADTLAAIGEAQAQGAKVLSIVNVPGSTIDRDSDAVLYTYAGREIGVASTKAFTTQLVVLTLFAGYLGKLRRNFPEEKMKMLLEGLRKLPNQLPKIFTQTEHIKKIAKKFCNHTNALYLGRGVGFPIALEGALKLKEISYIHAEGYPAAEMKHGPIALIDENMPTVVLAFKGRRYEKILGNIQEVKARKGKIIAVVTEGSEDLKDIADEIITIPFATETLSAILSVVPLQLLAYYIAVEKGCSVDQPRNLAKSVTVE
jgi:glucosamine--fructose-6-phosphate aminotransferase (isomerizing)